MHLTREPLIERQFGIERRSQWVIDCAVNVHILFEFQGISERYVTTKLIGSFPLTPRAALLKQRRQQPSGRKLFCLREFVPVHSDTLDDVGLQLMLADIEWSDVVTFSLGLPELLEAGEYNGPLLDLARSEIPSIASVDVVLVTADGKVVAARRSRHRDYYPQTWSLSYEEQLSRDPRRRTRQADANHFDAVVEGAWEEFHVTVLRESIRLASIHVCLPRYAAACLMIARCRETSAQLWSCWQQAIDKEEHDYVVTLEPELAALGPQFFHPNPAPECDESPVWHPTSRMRLLAFLSNRWGLGQTADFLHQWKATQT